MIIHGKLILSDSQTLKFHLQNDTALCLHTVMLFVYAELMKYQYTYE